ncbi:MAG: ribosome maturation factor RimM [bacterium]
MKKEDCFYLGRVVKKYSFKGELLIKLDTDEPELYEHLDALFLQVRRSLIPFIVEKSSLHKSNLLRVQLDDVDSEEDADRLLKSEVYLPLSTLPKLEGNKFYYHEIIGYKLKDENFGEVGEIIGVNDSTSQHLFVVKRHEKEILIPMHDEIIKKVDRLKNEIVVNTPNGLIELYL